jgi:hypothetical protein
MVRASRIKEVGKGDPPSKGTIAFGDGRSLKVLVGVLHGGDLEHKGELDATT